MQTQPASTDRCTRCNKQPALVWTYETKQFGPLRLILCRNCMSWAIETLLLASTKNVKTLLQAINDLKTDLRKNEQSTTNE
jgi:protein-arginine kinase activator protein McsA